MIKFKTIDGITEDFIPMAQTEFSAGLDVKSTTSAILNPGDIGIFGTGVKVEIDKSLYLELHVRSSLRFKLGMDQLGVGIIDADYKDEIKMLLKNEGYRSVEIKKGDRIGQLVVCENLTKIHAAKYYLNNKRDGGIGSTNK